MIAVQDLCIGNWVYDGEGTQFPMFIRAIGEDYVYLDFEGNEGDLWQSKPEDLIGIPLTAEILKKTGLRYEMGYWRLRLDSHITIEYYAHENRLRRYWQGIDEWMNHANIREMTFECQCYNLHEFQNAWNMATKQQLNIKL